MSRNEIRLRRHRVTATGADRFRNYSDVLQRHERDVRFKKIMRVFMMFMIILTLIGLIFVLWRVEEGDVPFENGPKKSSYEMSFPERSEGNSQEGNVQQDSPQLATRSAKPTRSATYLPDLSSKL